MPSKRCLLIKLGAIGDVVMAIPAAYALHRQGYSIDWVASEVAAPVLQRYPWIHVLAVREAGLLRGGLAGRTAAMVQLWRRLRGRTRHTGPYDLVATLYYDRRYRLLSLPVQSRRTLLLSRADRRFALLPGRHHTDEYARILTGRPDEQTPYQLAPVPVPDLPPTAYLAGPGRPRVVLVPAGARNLLRDDALRRWPIDSYVQLAGQLLARGCEVVLAGGPEDRWATPHFAQLAAQASEGSFVDLIGQLSLVESLSLFDSASVLVTHDTGPLHLAGITSSAIVAIFGPTDPHGRLPQRESTVALWGGFGFACRPCYDGRDYAPCPQNGCMMQVTPALVLEQVQRLLEARQRNESLLPLIVTPEHTKLVTIGAGA